MDRQSKQNGLVKCRHISGFPDLKKIQSILRLKFIQVIAYSKSSAKCAAIGPAGSIMAFLVVTAVRGFSKGAFTSELTFYSRASIESFQTDHSTDGTMSGSE